MAKATIGSNLRSAAGLVRSLFMSALLHSVRIGHLDDKQLERDKSSAGFIFAI
jgi:hypothetical protein